MARRKAKHDIYLNGKGYMLAEGDQALVGRVVTPLASKVVTGEPTYSDYDLYSVLAQNKFTSGAGLHDLEDPEGYKWEWNMDSRGDRVTKGPKVQSTRPSNLDPSGSLGQMGINGRNLLIGLARDPDESDGYWLPIDGNRKGVAIPFSVGQESTFDPLSIDGCKTWIAADHGTWQDNGSTAADTAGQLVKQWDDRANTLRSWSVSADTNRPTFRDDGTYKTVQSSGSLDRLTNDVPIVGDGNRTLFIVMKVGAAQTFGSGDYVFDFGSTGTGERWALTGNDGDRLALRVNGGNAIFGSIDRDTLFMVTIMQSGTHTDNITMWKDGNPSKRHSLNSAAIDTPEGTAARLFADAGVTNFSNVHIGEVIYYDSALSDTDRTTVERYLGNRWGLTIPVGPTYGMQHANIYLRSQAGFDTTVYKMNIRQDDGGKPGATIVGSTDVLPRAQVTYDGYWTYQAFTTEIVPPAGNLWLTFEIEGASVDGESVDVYMTRNVNIAQDYKVLDATDVWGDGDTTGIPSAPLLTADFQNSTPDITAQKMIEFRGKADRSWVYVLAGRKLYRIVSPNHIEPLSPTLTQDGTWLTVVRNRDEALTTLVICQGPGEPMLYWDGDLDTVVFNEVRKVDTTPVDAQVFVSFDSFYWRASIDNTNGVYVQASDAWDEWEDAQTSDPVQCGTSRFEVRHLLSWKSQLYAIKADGVYVAALQEGWTPGEKTYSWENIIDLTTVLHPSNGQAACTWQEDLYFTLAHGLARFTAANLFESVNPASMLRDQGRERGTFTALLPTLTQMYAGYSSRVGDWSWVGSYNGNWHILATLDKQGDPIEALMSDSGVYGDIGRIWYGSHAPVSSFVDTVESLNRYKYATGTSQSRILYNYRPATSLLPQRYSDFFTSWFSGTLINIYKDWVDLSVMCEWADALNYIDVYYRYEQEGEFSYLGRVDSYPVKYLRFPSESVGLKIQLKFRFVSANDYQTPIWIGYALRYLNRPVVAERIQISIVLADDILLHNGSVDPDTAAQKYQDLLDTRQAPESVELVEPSGLTRLISVDDLGRNRMSEMYWNDRRLTEVMLVTLGAIETGGWENN